jgi:hypothetical protein
MANPGTVITSEVIASLVGETWAQSATPVNILSGFKKCVISPLNPSEIYDRMLAPFTALNASSDSATSATPTFSVEQISLYEQRFREGYDLQDSQYELWVKENHPGSSDTDSLMTHVSNSRSHSSKYLSDTLQYPEPKVTSRVKKPGMNISCAVCLSDSPVVKQLREKEERKRHLEEEKLRKKDENEKRKLNGKEVSY